jgi:hypothetical protein
MPWRRGEPFFVKIWTLDVRCLARRGAAIALTKFTRFVLGPIENQIGDFAGV